MKRILPFLALVLVGAPSFVSAQLTDTLPPVLDVSQSGFTPSTIDVTGGPQDVTVTLFVTDDLSGVSFTTSTFFPGPGIVFRSPSGVQVQGASDFSFSLVSGDPLAGQWQAAVTFPASAESGDWTVESITLEDRVGNRVTLDTGTLISMGFPTTLTVLGLSDVTPPTLTSLAIDPLTVDTSSDFQTVTFTLGLTDAESGVDFSYRPGAPWALGILSPVGNFIRICSDPILASGDSLAGTWTSSCYLPRYSQAGTWRIWSVSPRDAAGNSVTIGPDELASMGFPTTFELTSTPSDTSPPALSTFSFSPTFIDTSVGPATVTATASLTDDISGFSAIQVNFSSPSGGQNRLLYVSRVVSGDALNGTFDGSVEFPQYSEAGTWQVSQFFYYDQVFNYRSLSTADMRALGLPTVLNVVLPSLVGDGSIGPEGGTVTDTVFGDRAQLTLPPGAVSGPTDVAIDVLESPLTFPMPTGFSGPGTYYVNISFTPPPSMPFPPPGATVVLPLVNPMPPGTSLTLYRVDPATGGLVPAVSVSGGPVIGTVGPSGDRATFEGVAHFSVVVGLLPDNQPPVVTPPASITVPATEAGGARGAASAALAAFLAGGTATDNADPSPARLAPQAGGSDATDATLFPLGTTTVTFRFRDVAGNVGTATATVTVVVGRPRLSGRIARVSTPAPGLRAVELVLTNTGTGNARDVQVSQVLFKTLSGSGAVTLSSPVPPLAIGSLDVGASTTVSLTLNVPATVKRFSITENGMLKDVRGTSLGFSLSQSVIP